MKRFMDVWLFIGLALILSAASAIAQNNPLELRLPFEKAVIDYDISGSQKGTETLYIRDFGNERVKITKSKGKMLFVTTATDAIEITTRDTVITIDRANKTGTRMTNPQKFMQMEMEKLSDKERKVVMKNLETIGMNMAMQMGGDVRLKAGKHLGYSCDLVTVMGTTSCQMSGTPIMLKMESSLMGVKMDTVAKKIDTKAAIPADVFKLPNNVNISYSKEADEMSHAMITSMVESMKDPDAAKKFKEGMAQSKMQMEQAQRQQAQERETGAIQDEGETSSEPDEQQLDEMMQKGMDTFKGLFK